MSTATQSADTFEPRTAAPAALSPTRPFYWSVRRELWEHRSIYLAPLIAAGLVLFGFLIRIAHLPQTVRDAASLPEAAQYLQLAAPYGIAAATIAVTGFIVAIFYCLGALHGERRDRSILFWKSLPVSNVTAVLSKAFVPFAMLPAVVLAVIVALQLVMLLLGSAVVIASGLSAQTLWNHWPIVRMALLTLYTLMVITLWYAPIYGWCLLVSSWAKSMPILWAALPPLGLCVFERIATDTEFFSSLLDYRLGGFLSEAFYYDKHAHPRIETLDPLSILTPAHFLASPGLWSGLAVAAAMIAAAIWLRRNRDPI